MKKSVLIIPSTGTECTIKVIQGITPFSKKCFIDKVTELEAQCTFLASGGHQSRESLQTKGCELATIRNLMSAPVLAIPEQNNDTRIGSLVITKDEDEKINNFFIDGTIPPKKVPLPLNHYFISTSSPGGKKWLGKKVGEKVTRVEKGEFVTGTIIKLEPYSVAQKIFFPEFQLQETAAG